MTHIKDMQPVLVTDYTLATAAGLGKTATWESIKNNITGLKVCEFEDVKINTYIGKIGGLDNEPVDKQLEQYDCRNNRIIQLAMRQDNFEASVFSTIQKYGSKRIGVLIGTSTSGINKLEQDYRKLDINANKLPNDNRERYTHNLFSAAEFIRARFNIQGPAIVVSTACSSSAKVFASALRWINSGVCDAAIVGGADSLCLNTLYGFDSLQLLSTQPCKPFDLNRSGISIGEGAAFIILEKQSSTSKSSGIRLLGYGESTDGFHMSSPSPEGSGALKSMQNAIAMANLSSQEIDYINLHGTGSDANDIAESSAVNSLFGDRVTCSATKGWFGHTLGAAGAIESVVGYLALENSTIPGTINTEIPDPELKINLALNPVSTKFRYFLKNSFGFGGNNCSLLFGK